MSISSFRTKIDLIKHELRTNGRRAALERAKYFFFAEPLGGLLVRTSHPRVEWGKGVIIHGRLDMLGPGRVVMGADCFFSNSNGIANRIVTTTPEAVVEFGDGVVLSGATIIAAKAVRIGNHTLLGPCTVVDTDFHPVDATARLGGRMTQPVPVVIGNDVWVGREAAIMQGVTVGDGAVIGARAVIRASVNEGQVVVGNPQRVTGDVRAARPASDATGNQ